MMKFLYVAIVGLSVALLPLPYTGYQLIKLMVTVLCSYAAFKLYEKRELNLPFWGIIFIAILFNPVTPFYMSRSAWMIWDVISAIFLYWSILQSGRLENNRSEDLDKPLNLSSRIEKSGDDLSKKLIWHSLGALFAIFLLAYLLRRS
jgi:hypothetical protein